jgi:NAD(P)-dependent dehydrogenase (short-subunit alcohol dehydrogenase family)
MGLGQSAYAAAKAGVISLTQTMAVHYGAQNVRVNCLCPGTIVTPATECYWGSQFSDWKERLGRCYPLNRIGTPEEVANAALFLASDESSFITGAIIPVDGGLTAGQKLFAT